MKVVPFVTSEWAAALKFKPSFVYQNLAMKPTPIHSWSIPGTPSDFQISIKRDDMTGSVLFGNKIRKLEFILADAVKRGCKNLITTGGINSNHCRATAGAGALLGLKTHLILRSNDYQDPPNAIGEPNLLTDRLFGADIYLMPKATPYLTGLKPAMETLAARILKETGEESAHIPVGGSDPLGVYGPMMAFEEMRSQGLFEVADDIVVAVGSGGTACGLAVANYLCNSPLKVHAISVCDDKEYFYNHCQEVMDALGVDAKAEDILNIIDGYKAPGYAIASPEVLNTIQEVARTTGIVLDPVYTGKAVYGMLQEMKKRQGQFKGRRTLFMHTGGVLTKAAIETMQMDTKSFRMQTWKG